MSSEAPERSTLLTSMALRREQDVVLCRNRARTIAGTLRFDRQQQVRIATAISEIARNAFHYAREAKVEFSVARSRVGAGLISYSFVTVVRDRGPGISDLPSILAGTYRSTMGKGKGILAAKRLMDEVHIDTAASGTTVRLVQTLPKGSDLSPLELQGIANEIGRASQAQLLDELAEQNQELIITLDQLNTQRIELAKINDELGETNRGVVALYDELDTVQRVSRVVASKLELADLLQAITDATVEVSGAECGGFFRKEPPLVNFTCQTVAGPLGIAFQNCSLLNADELIASGTDQQIVRVDDLTADNSRPFPLNPYLPIRSFLVLGVRNSIGEIAGALVFAHRSPAVFTERTERILAIVALQVAVGLENAQLYRSARAASAAKDQFLAILSHELRTPLTPIFAILATIERYPELPEKIRSDLLVINRNLQLEARLIDDLLDLTRINKGKISLLREIIDVHKLIRSVGQLCQVAIDTQQVRLEMHLEAPRHHLFGDAGRLQQVLWNLLSNAIKFTPAGGTVSLRTSVVAGNKFCLCLTDSGRGIDSDLLERIFQPFEQGDLAVPPQFGGLGLGLAIARAIVDAHQGQIQAESSGPGQGATFTVTLPLAEDNQIQEAEPPRPEKPVAGKTVRVLLVDDHDDTLEFMSRFLKLSGHEVITASSYGQALNAGKQHQFDVVISDIGLPDGNGYALMQALQARSPVKGIALSGYGMKADVDRSLAAGFAAHLTKPCDLSVLNATIEKVLS
jgi:signal transduction histidine kinase/CheY-like chemotaxis protein